MAEQPAESEHLGPDTARERADTRQSSRLAVTGIVLLAVVVFVVQNSERVETTFLVFSVTTRLWVGLVVALVAGVVLSQALEAVWRRRRRARDRH
jgi:uncharacterized integral membrane protein